MNVIRAHLVCFVIFCGMYQVFAQESCFNKYHSRYGNCISLLDCSSAKEIIINGGNDQNCGFNGSVPLVCCLDPKIEPKVLRKSAAMCKEIIKDVYIMLKGECRDVPDPIGGGVKAIPKEFPHMVAIGYQNSNSETAFLCGGSLISSNFVLTAAHCLTSIEYGSPKTVRIGDLVLNSDEDDAQPQNINISKIHKHPDYKRPAKYNDIALLELERNVDFTPYAYPACLPDREDIETYSSVKATGWGNTNAWGDKSDSLMTVEIHVFPHENCSQSFQVDRKLPNGISNKTQLCAGSLGGRKDTCSGDSGGPLQTIYGRLCNFVVIGLTSFGKPCLLTSAPGVYTKVYPYLDWIENIVWP